MAQTWRLLPPANVAQQTIVHQSGRSYTATPGGALNVPDFDGVFLRANGWHLAAVTGTTAQRPADGQMPAGCGCYFDTSISTVIFPEGKNVWRDINGNLV